jgi:hypothetical protein
MIDNCQHHADILLCVLSTTHLNSGSAALHRSSQLLLLLLLVPLFWFA